MEIFMPEKHDETNYSVRQTDAYDSWCRLREHKALLRSLGHRVRDGSWDENDPGFHVYNEVEDPAFVSLRTFRCHPSYTKSADADPFGFSRVDCNWKPAISRSVESVRFDPSTYHQLPPIEFPLYEDFVLNLNAQGTDFIVKNRPGNPLVSLGQYIIELRELPQVPHFLRTTKHQISDIGSEYLNVEFGWKPLIKDLMKIHDLQFKIARKINDLVKNNGIPVRRRSKKVVSTDSFIVREGSLSIPFGDLSDPSIGGHSDLKDYTLCGPFGGLVTYPNWSGQADYRLSRTTYETVWNCGTFKYYVPDIGSNQWTERAIKALYGTDLTPSLLYSVYPWTWLTDWFINVGDIISNLSKNAVDNETLTNCYSMYTKTVYDVVDVSVHWDEVNADSLPGVGFFLPAGSDTLKHTIARVNKLRHQSSPFGFGLKRGDFSATQLAILAALAVSRIDSARSWLRSFAKDVKLLS